MKLKSVALILGFVAAAALAAEQPSITGKWQVHTSIAGNENDHTCSLTQKGTELTGTCTTGQSGTVNLTGKVDGKKVTWSYKSDYNGTPITVNYDGTWEAGKMSGTVSVPEFSVDGQFTGIPAK